MSDKITFASNKASYFEKDYRPIIKIDNKQITDLFNLVGSMNINDIKQFMLIEHIPYNVVDNNNNTLIHRVLLENDLLKTENQRLQMIKFLYNENAHPDAPNNNNITPLHLACMKQYINIIKFLIDIGVDVNYQDNFGNTPLHRLFSGNIKPEEKTTIGNLIPKPKKIDSINNAKWKKERIKIWNDIKDSQFIKAIDETLKYSIGSEEEEIKVVIDFQEQLLAMNLDLKKLEDIKLLKDLQAGSIHKFKEIMEKKWGKFSSIGDINMHQIEPDSFPQNDPSKLAIIKNSNTKKHISITLNKKLDDVIKILKEFNKIDITQFNTDNINKQLLTDYLSIKPNDLVKRHFENNHVPHYYDYNNKYKHPNSHDFADNVINIDNNTFIGGARKIFINDNVDDVVYNQLFNNNKQIEHIIPTIVYTLFIDFDEANNFNGNYNIIRVNIHLNFIVEFIIKIINNTFNKTDINDFIIFINNNAPDFIHLIKLLNNLNAQTDKIGWLYCFMNNILCTIDFVNSANTITNLTTKIPLTIIYLIAGMLNSKSNDNLILSISQCMRKSLYKYIYNDRPPPLLKYGFIKPKTNNQFTNHENSSLLCALIYLIFAVDNKKLIENLNKKIDHNNNLFTPDYRPPFINFITNDIDESDELKYIIKYAYDIINNLDTTINNTIPDSLKGPEYEPKERLCSMISKYYNSMEQPPQMQMVADLIDLIRKNTSINQFDIKQYFKNFILKTCEDDAAIPAIPANIETLIDPNLQINIANRNMPNYNQILGDNDQANNIFTVVSYSLPSRVNYFMALPDDNNRENITLYTLKFTECYYLGLNFLGQVQPLTIIDSIRTRTPHTLELNLFEFNNYLRTNLKPRMIINHPMFYTFNNKYYNRPTTIISVIKTVLHIEQKLNEYMNVLTQRFVFIFNRMKTEKSVDLYAKAISYLYPDLLILHNYSKIFESINKTLKQFDTILEEINKSTNIDIKNLIDNFNIFKLKNFEMSVNQINGYIYLLYYLNATTEKMKIPKFIYHALGNDKPLIVFDNSTNNNNNFNLPNPNSNENRANETDITLFDERKGHINREISLFSNVINNIGFITKEILDKDFIISKNKKLPPSLRVVLNEFYRFNIIEVIKNNQTSIDNTLISVEINEKTKNIQLLYIKAKIIEEIIQLYLKNKINEYGRDIYNKLLTDKVQKTLETQQLFETIDFSLDLNQLPDADFINSIDVTTQNKLKLFYSFVEPKKMKEQFYIYPDNYFGTNLLKNKYTININLDIIKLMLENNSNILIHNSEKISPLVMMIKNYFHEAFPIINNNFDTSMYDNNNFYSPQYYLIENYKTHLGSYGDQIYESQLNEMVTIIQSNESYNNNILKYMDVSFGVVKYITEQYLTENMIRFSDDFNTDNLKDMLKLSEFTNSNINDIGKCIYNELLGGSIIIPNSDELITKNTIIEELIKKRKEKETQITKYTNEKTQLENLGLDTTNITNKITSILNDITSYETQINTLSRITSNAQNKLTLTSIPKIIKRYDELLNNMNNTPICYMEGWKQLISRDIKNIDRIPSYCIDFQNKSMTDNNNPDFKTNLNKIHKFYKHNYNIIKTYFENPRYIIGDPNNKVLSFVYDLLVHLTKTFICSNIESIIKKILYEYIISIQKIPITSVLDQINLIVDGIHKVLYNIIPQKFVRNSVSIYNDTDDESENSVETVAEILNNLIDLLKTSSYIDINDYTINILKNNIVQYFDTITYKLINNWNVVIENIFLYHINHYRIIECMINIIN
jgi:hypothetical protein